MKILFKLIILLSILIGMFFLTIESLRFSRDQVRILNAQTLSKSVQYYYIKQGEYPPSGNNENVCYYLYNRKLLDKPMRDPAYLSNVIFFEKNIYLIKQFIRELSLVFNSKKLKEEYKTLKGTVVSEFNELRSIIVNSNNDKDSNIVSDDNLAEDDNIINIETINFDKIIDNEGIPIECSINYVSNNIDKTFEISVFLESKYSKNRMRWDGGNDSNRYEIGNNLKMNSSSKLINGNLTTTAKNISLIQ
ncbi:MAG: hypothetical protein CMG08_07755 [Candidatus Marinimicrobia bacterium]|nr:hypothetical protein [Candidatus Neomarinimicrobiota bacterium]